MNVSQVPQNEGSVPMHSAGDGPQAYDHDSGEASLWSEELPWVDEGASAVGTPRTAPHEALDQVVKVSKASSQHPPSPNTEGKGDQIPTQASLALEPQRQKRRGTRAVGATLVGIGVIAVAAVLATQHEGAAGVAAAPVGRDEIRADSSGTALNTSITPSLDPSPARRHGPAMASPSPALDGGEVALFLSPSSGTKATAPAGRANSHSPEPRASHSTHPMPQQSSPTDTTTQSPFVIQATAVLNPGQSVTWGKARLAMTSDGNLVVTDERGATRWASHTSGSGLQTVFQNDGLMAIYDSQGNVQWSSNTNGHPGAVLEITADGNVRIKLSGTVLWQTGTGH